ncbi:MAG: DUF2442 domain-containing protein [Acidobacteriota bacterium]
MQPTANAETDRALEVAPGIRHTVSWRVESVTVLPETRLRVTFLDRTTGEVDMLAVLATPQIEGTVFESLRQPEVFAQARVVLGAVQWPNGADLAPDAMYDAIHEGGVWVVD